MTAAQAWPIRVVSSAARADVGTEASRTIAAAPTIKADTLGRQFSICCFLSRCLRCPETRSRRTVSALPTSRSRACRQSSGGNPPSHAKCSRHTGITWPLLASLARSCAPGTRFAGNLWTPYHLLQSVRSLAAGSRLRPDLPRVAGHNPLGIDRTGGRDADARHDPGCPHLDGVGLRLRRHEMGPRQFLRGRALPVTSVDRAGAKR
jgi:hypothetical protein